MSEQFGKVRLKNARLAFSNIFEARAFQPDQDPAFSCLFLMEKGSDAHKALSSTIKDVVAAKWKEQPKGLKLCLRPGSEKDGYDGFTDEMVFTSARSKTRPETRDRRGRPSAREDGLFYSGCVVNGIVRVWAQDNQYGKRINCELLGVQFVRDGTPYGGGGVGATDADFEDLGDEEEAVVASGADDEDDLLG